MLKPLAKLLFRRRPPVGWSGFGLALAAALTPALAAAQSPLHPPGAPFIWAGLIGLIVGADGAGRPPARSRHALAGRVLTHAIAWAIGIVLLIAAAGEALPPAGLIQQDLSAIIDRAAPAIWPELPIPAARAPRTLAFLDNSIARLTTDLAAAPGAGERGARLLLSVVGSVATWFGALMLGRATATGRALLGLALPLLCALALIALPGGAGGWPLAFGILLTTLFVAIGGFACREQDWEQRATDYSSELRQDVALWAILTMIVALVAGWALPLWPGNPIARALESIGDFPSGVAALNRGIQRPGTENSTAEIGLSTLPGLELGISLAKGPPGQPALTITPRTPMPPSSEPRYWRLRVFNSYDGSGWSARARVSLVEPAAIGPSFPGAVVQEINDFRTDRQLLIGLPDVIALNVPTRFEHFEDGSIAAIAGNPPVARYIVLSRPLELAPLPPRDREPPDLSMFLGLPRNLPPRVRELAQAITGDRRGDYERALAMESYLRNLPYTYEVRPIPGEGDAVDQFLFEMRSGYCTYYASSMVVMARSLGIPARLAVGYATGELTPEGAYIVRESDAHAWPELYINERWITFEPTPIRELPERSGPRPLPEPAPAEPEPTETPLWIWAGLGMTILALAGLALFWIRRRSESSPDLLDQALAALERSGARRGIAWPRGATMREYEALLSPQAKLDAGMLRAIITLIERGRYAGRQLDATDSERLRQLVTDLSRAQHETETRKQGD